MGRTSYKTRQRKRSQVWPTSVNLTGLAGIAAFSLSLTLTLNLAKKVGRPQKKKSGMYNSGVS